MQRQHLVPWLFLAASFLACDPPAGFALVSAKPVPAKARQVAPGLETGASAGGGPRPFQVNRPFLFLIRDNASGLVLFLGRVNDPSRR